VTATVERTEDTIRRLELAVTRKLDGLLQGDHQGLVPGGGSDPGDGRLYEPGDDVRRMDWNLTARMGAPHVRDTIADRELETWLLVDASASIDFGTATCEKRDLALAAAASFGFLTARDGNRVGAVTFGPAGFDVRPPRAGRDAVLALLHRLDRRPRAAPGEAPLADALRRLRTTTRRRGLVVVVSDLLDGSDWPRELRALAARHEVVVCELRDAREDELPDVGLLALVDPETGRRLEVQTADRRLRARFATAAAERRATTTRAVRTAPAAHLVLSTDRDWLLDVVRFVANRRLHR
jgi:uncharacterized protein (DUF58 family)